MHIQGPWATAAWAAGTSRCARATTKTPCSNAFTPVRGGERAHEPVPRLRLVRLSSPSGETDRQVKSDQGVDRLAAVREADHVGPEQGADLEARGPMVHQPADGSGRGESGV